MSNRAACASGRKLREDVSMKVHANLAVALILLNAHFLSSQAAALSSDGLCFYVALALHYSLLATFSWMALESFHLYLLLVRVFNIYIRRYMLKLGLAGWSESTRPLHKSGRHLPNVASVLPCERQQSATEHPKTLETEEKKFQTHMEKNKSIGLTFAAAPSYVPL